MYDEFDPQMMDEEELDNAPTGEGNDEDEDLEGDDLEEGLDEEEL